MNPTVVPLQRPTFREACRLWLKIGCLSFGGPAGQISLMHEELVAKRRWVDESRFQHALQFCILLPGPEAQQLATYLGWWLHGTRGGIVAGTLFVLPAAILLLVLSWGYALWGAVPWVSAALQGLQPAVVALIGVALIRLSTRWLRTPKLWLMALGTWLGIRWGLPFPVLLLMAFVISLLWQGIRPAVPVASRPDGAERPSAPSATPRTDWKRSVRVFLVCMVLWWLPVGLVAAWLGAEHVLVREGCFLVEPR